MKCEIKYMPHLTPSLTYGDLVYWSSGGAEKPFLIVDNGIVSLLHPSLVVTYTMKQLNEFIEEEKLIAYPPGTVVSLIQTARNW